MVEKTKENPRKKTNSDKKIREKMIREKAYEIYENGGRKQGKALDDWLEAEMIVSQEEGK